ncbi:MAG: hypothetical protein R2854_22495 [Caldilineaceae bacterium]
MKASPRPRRCGGQPPRARALAYRTGVHASFNASMQARISTMPALQALATRDADDFSLRSWIAGPRFWTCSPFTRSASPTRTTCARPASGFRCWNWPG